MTCKVSLHSQASAVDVALGQIRSRSLKMRPAELQMLERNLAAAAQTMWLINAWRDRLPERFVAEIEGAE